jgi:hypothetical protein
MPSCTSIHASDTPSPTYLSFLPFTTHCPTLAKRGAAAVKRTESTAKKSTFLPSKPPSPKPGKALYREGGAFQTTFIDMRSNHSLPLKASIQSTLNIAADPYRF